MSKLSKQDKIEIYHLWHDYQIGPAELSPVSYTHLTLPTNREV